MLNCKGMQAFFLALQFLTRIPVPCANFDSDQKLGQSVLFYPLVGLFIGGLLVSAAYAMQDFPLPIQSAVIVIIWVFITGGLHLDGLADCADAWAGGLGDVQRSLEIMKDPAAGPMAVVILVLLLLLKWSACWYVLQSQQFLVLLLAPVAGRVSILGLMISTPYVRQHGLGEKIQKVMPENAVLLIVLIGLLLISWLLNVGVVVIALITVFWVRWLAIQRIGGMTGDVYGAAVELVEATVLTASIY